MGMSKFKKRVVGENTNNGSKLGDNNMLAYDGYSEIFIIQTTYSQYLWMISLLILIFLERIEECGLISIEEIKTAWKETMYNE